MSNSLLPVQTFKWTHQAAVPRKGADLRAWGQMLIGIPRLISLLGVWLEDKESLVLSYCCFSHSFSLHLRMHMHTHTKMHTHTHEHTPPEKKMKGPVTWVQLRNLLKVLNENVSSSIKDITRLNWRRHDTQQKHSSAQLQTINKNRKH